MVLSLLLSFSLSTLSPPSLSAAALAQLSKDPKFQSILQKHLAASKNSYEKYALNIIIIVLCVCVCGGGGGGGCWLIFANVTIFRMVIFN